MPEAKVKLPLRSEDRQAICKALVKSYADTSFTALQASVTLQVEPLEALVILEELWKIGCIRCQGGMENNCFRMSPEEVATA